MRGEGEGSGREILDYDLRLEVVTMNDDGELPEWIHWCAAGITFVISCVVAILFWRGG